MRINYTARHTNIAPETRKYCEKRLKSIEKLLGYAVDADVILSTEKYRNKAEINIRTKGGTLNAVGETGDMSSSLVTAFDNIDRRVKKERTKMREKKRRKSEVDFSLPVSEEEGPRKVFRSRDISMKPMSVEEALLQFESSRREVLVFRKFDSEKWAVLYRRKDGNFGLVEPE